MEDCVDILDYQGRELVSIKQPGSNRHPNGDPIEKILMTREEAGKLTLELAVKLGIQIQPIARGSYPTRGYC